MSDDHEDTYDLPEDRVSFVGPCTCEHEPGEHGWMGCEAKVLVDGREQSCPCEAAWEE